jgi:hypothetical protein
MRRTFSGTDRAGGGAFERLFISLVVFGGDGLLTRLEHSTPTTTTRRSPASTS